LLFWQSEPGDTAGLIFLYDDPWHFYRQYTGCHFLFYCPFGSRRPSFICDWQEIVLSPFMLDGALYDYRQEGRNHFKWSSLQLKANPEACKHCHACTNNCPMSLPVEDMVQKESMENVECILCGTCVDGCKQDVLKYAWE
jgi:ferredoxin